MPKTRIAVIGSANIDLTTFSDRFPNAGETIFGQKFDLGFGGKGANQAVASRLCGADVFMVARVGSDLFGPATIENFKKLGIDVGGLEEVVRAFDDEDSVLAVGLDEDRGHAAGCAFDLLHMRGINAELLEILNRRRAEQITAHAGDHENIRAAKAGGDSLIRAFAAETKIEFLAEDGFSRVREAVAEGGEVDVGAADYCDAGLWHDDLFVDLRKTRKSRRRGLRVSTGGGVDVATRNSFHPLPVRLLLSQERAWRSTRPQQLKRVQ